MSSFQKLTLIGYLGKDPEIRYTPSGTAVAAFSVATTEKWKDKGTNAMQERTTWHNVEAWGRQAEICGEYLHKGAQVFIEGKIRQEEWEKDGVKQRMTKVRLDNIVFLNTKSGEPRTPGQGGQSSSSSRPEPQQQENFDDDIPFSWALIPMGGAAYVAQEMLQLSAGIIA